MNGLSKFLTSWLCGLLLASLSTEIWAGTESRTDVVVAANNVFAFDLLAHLSERSSNNIFLAPISIATTVAAAHYGARKDTAKGMAEALHWPPGTTNIDEEFGALLQELNDTNIFHNQLILADSLWVQQGYQFQASFLKVVHDDYLAQFKTTDFGGDGTVARKQINDWTFARTQGKIKEIVPQNSLIVGTKLVLINAVYFKGRWATKFDGSFTRSRPFFSDEGISNTVPTMSLAASLNWAENNRLQMLELPYESNRFSMLIFLPRRGQTLKEIGQTFTFQQMQQLVEEKRLSDVNVYLPRFNIQSKIRLDKPLTAMGMANAFSEAADFSGVEAGESLSIGAVLHDANIDVDEEGTEAAATGSVDARVISQPFVFKANHPFLFVIRDNVTGVILFMGEVSHPIGEGFSNSNKQLGGGARQAIQSDGYNGSAGAEPAAEQYRKEALKLLIREANSVAAKLMLPDKLPITESNLVKTFILVPRRL